MERNDRAPKGLSRRDVLRRSAAAGAVAGATWVAPSILTLDAAAACGSVVCTTGTTTFRWSTQYPTQAALAPANVVQALAATAVGGVTVTPTRSDPAGQNLLSGGHWRIRGTASGACSGTTEQLWHLTPTPNSWLKCRMGDAGTANAAVQTTLAFSQAVRDLTFSILDIDAVLPNTYRDRVRISGTTTGGTFGYVVLLQGSGIGVTAPGLGPGNTGTATTEFFGVGPGAISDCSTTNTPVIDTLGIGGSNGGGNLRICITQPVTSVTVTHQRGANNSGTNLVGGQHIGIGDLTWCTVT